jgi:hypothetical protein
MFWKDVSNHNTCRALAEKKVKFMLNIENNKNMGSVKNGPLKDYLRDHHKYGFGNVRSLNDFWKASGIDFSKADQDGVENWGYHKKVSSQFSGFNFNKNGYQEIKQFHD